MDIKGSSLQNAALAFLNERQPVLRKLGLGDLADLAAQKTAAPPEPLPKPESAPQALPARPQRPGSQLDIKV
ncbi:MAG: hypothetical protein KBA31_05910 [Alphaproteobacteria bacterium]|nr:hypothetical protein [Alphaproteobacteria bacterium]